MLSSLDEIGPLVEDPAPMREFERTSGLPWNRTMEQLKDSYGIERWRDFQDVVPLRGLHALGLTVDFRHRVLPPQAAYPAYEFQAELNPHRDHLANHQWTVRHLAAHFGHPPKIADVSNCLQATWEFGLFEVTVRTFLRDKRLGPNDLYARHPDLWQVANLTVESRLIAVREPEHFHYGDGLDLCGVQIGRGDRLTNRLLTAPREGDGLRLWRERAKLRVGVANRWASIVRPLQENARLVLLEMTPARGAGSASIDLDGVTLVTNPQWDALRETAARIAAFLAVPLQTETQPDE